MAVAVDFYDKCPDKDCKYRTTLRPGMRPECNHPNVGLFMAYGGVLHKCPIKEKRTK